jgi:uncharacterized protein (TIGR00251 family)
MAMPEQDLILNVRVQPSAKKDEISGWMADGTLKIRLRAKPVEGQANQGLIQFISKTFKIAKGDIEILSGEHVRNKRLKINGLTKEILDRYLTKQGD